MRRLSLQHPFPYGEQFYGQSIALQHAFVLIGYDKCLLERKERVEGFFCFWVLV